MWLMQNGLANPDNAGAASTDYLHLFGLTALAYMWAMMAKTALAKIAAGASDPHLCREAGGRAATTWPASCRRPAGRLAKLKTGAETLMALPAEAVLRMAMGTYRATSDWSLAETARTS